jgi:hypothetical protein
MPSSPSPTASTDSRGESRGRRPSFQYSSASRISAAAAKRRNTEPKIPMLRSTMLTAGNTPLQNTAIRTSFR